jgi:hypothetical protein
MLIYQDNFHPCPDFLDADHAAWEVDSHDWVGCMNGQKLALLFANPLWQYNLLRTGKKNKKQISTLTLGNKPVKMLNFV